MRFAGHHLKVWHYFNHVLASPEHTPRVRFSPESRLDDTNPWMSVPDLVLKRDATVDPNIWFFSGMDWTSMPAEQREDSPLPVINLVQHPTHFDPRDPRYALLSNRAIRICVSPEESTALEPPFA